MAFPMSNLTMIQSRTMRLSPQLLPLLLGMAIPAAATDHTPPAVTPATSFAAVEVHNDEHLAIAVEPYDTKEKQSIFHIDYTKYGVMPVRLIITNLGDTPISLRDARILFETASGDRVQAAEPEDVERLMNPRERPSTLPMPSPIPGVHLKPKNKNKEVEDDFDTFEYQALVVEPHTTRAGFLFYVLQGVNHPLPGAHMYVRDLKNVDGKELFYFEIPFDKYLNGKTAAATSSTN
jgi:hypothetical protein